MKQMLNKILQEAVRFLVSSTSRKFRKTIYFTPFINRYLRSPLTKILHIALYRHDFQWFKFSYGYRAGLEMKLKLPEESEFYLETHDSDVTVLLHKYIRPGFTVIDVGAHIGYFTLFISRLAGLNGKVFAVEPLPKNVGRLKEHLIRNHCGQNTKVLQLALAECDKNEEFLCYDISTVGKLSSPESSALEKTSRRITVECRTLDSLLKDNIIQPPDLVKIDVEGAELRVLQGMADILRIYKPCILIETHNEKNCKDVIEFMENRGYCAYLDGKQLDNKSPLPKTAVFAINILCQYYQ